MYELESIKSSYRKLDLKGAHEGNDYVVYEHINTDKNEVFYVGCGTKTRAYSLYPSSAGRPSAWRDIIKNFNCDVNIVAKELSKEEAKKLEAELIDKYKRIIDGGTLVNLATIGNKRAIGELGRPVLMFDCFGRFIQEFPNANVVDLSYGRVGEIGECCKEPIIDGIIKRSTGKGKYLWRYKDEYNSSIPFIGNLKGTGGVTPIIRIGIEKGKFIIYKVYLSAKYVESEFVPKAVSNASMLYARNKKLMKHRGYYFIRFFDLEKRLKEEVLNKHDIEGY